MPPADQAHGLLSVQLLIALLQMDMKILSRGRVIVIHVKGDLEVDAADGLHQRGTVHFEGCAAGQRGGGVLGQRGGRGGQGHHQQQGQIFLHG